MLGLEVEQGDIIIFHTDLFNLILGQNDFVRKQNDIIQFCLK